MTDWALRRTASGEWALVVGTREHRPVSVVRAYPLSGPEEGVAVLDADGHELLWVEHLRELDEARREALLQAASAREFTPVISAILAISTVSTPSRWTVRTDRGITDLVLPGEEALQRVGARSVLVSDAAGVQYLVRDIGALDRPSRKFLERFL